MALIVEDGTGVTGANTYSSLTDISTYLADRGYATWATMATADQESAVLRAMVYIEGKRFKGTKYNRENPLQWPRAQCTDGDGVAIPGTEIPDDLKRAVAEASFREITSGTLLPDLDRGGRIIREKISGAVEIEYAKGASGKTKFQAIDIWLRGFLQSGITQNLVRC